MRRNIKRKIENREDDKRKERNEKMSNKRRK